MSAAAAAAAAVFLFGMAISNHSRHRALVRAAAVSLITGGLSICTRYLQRLRTDEAGRIEPPQSRKLNSLQSLSFCIILLLFVSFNVRDYTICARILCRGIRRLLRHPAAKA